MTGLDPPGGGDARGADPAPRSVTAYVIMKPADRSLSPGVLDLAITSENIGALQPAASDLEAATGAFAALGFAVGPFVGISFSITGSSELFVATFGSGALEASPGGRLPLGVLTEGDPVVAEAIETVVLDEPAELFGTEQANLTGEAEPEAGAPFWFGAATSERPGDQDGDDDDA
ncbi:MAG: hypothetical protein WBM50_08580 [Acidimicrobiales bacterium]